MGKHTVHVTGWDEWRATLELRWFFDGDVDDSFARWFTGGAAPDWSAIPNRTDDYLSLPGVLDIGIKIRERRFEVKGRRELLGTQVVAKGAVGVVERWIKWSYGEADRDVGP